MQDKLATVLVIDGQGGGIGKSIISALKNLDINAKVVCAGTNRYAAERMSGAGADIAVFGDKSIIECIKQADIITGPIGIIIPNSLKGEISAEIANSVAQSDAVKILVPLNKCNIIVAGVHDKTLADNIDEVAKTVKLKLSDFTE